MHLYSKQQDLCELDLFQGPMREDSVIVIFDLQRVVSRVMQLTFLILI